MGFGGGSVPAAPYATNPQVQNSTQVNSSAGFMSGSGSSNTSGTGSSAAAGQNTFTPQQQGLQGNVLESAQNFLQTGNLPGTFAAPQQVFDAYKSNYNQTVAPMIAASGGAGSPALASNLALGLEQLASNLYQSQSANFGNALATAGGLAFNPTGYTQAQTANQNSQTDWQSQQAATANQVSNLHSVLATLKV